MESVVDEPLGDIHRAYAFFRLQLVAEDDLVHAGRVVREIVGAFESFANVVGVENRVFSGLAKAFGSVGLNIGESTDEHPEVPVVGTHAADGMRTVVFEA